MEAWNPIWLVLSGFYCLVFEITGVEEKTTALRDLAKLGLQTVLNFHQPVEKICLKKARLYQQTGSQGEKKFWLEIEDGQQFHFRATEHVADDWNRTLVATIHGIALDFHEPH